jgi:endonuclease YncB( thermonuclease family)
MDRTFIDPEGQRHLLIDGDTFTNKSGERFRIGNINAREIDKVVEGEDGLEFKRGQVGGIAQTDAVAKTIQDGGFNEIEYTGEYDSNGREIVNLFDSRGKSLSTRLVEAGIIEVSEFTDKEAIVAKRERELYEAAFGKQKDPINDLGDVVSDYIDSQGLVYKDKAITEAYYDPELHTGVNYRDFNRNIDNTAIGFTGEVAASWDQGWDGVKEGFWGYIDALGQTTGIEMAEELGEAGVRRARARMADAPETIISYKDVDNIWDGFQYVVNNAVMSAPYMATTFGAMAAAIPLAPAIGVAGATALTMTPNAMIYAGHTWNEMEGEKGVSQFVAATTIGAASATIERLGMQLLIKPSSILTKTGIQRSTTVLMSSDKPDCSNCLRVISTSSASASFQAPPICCIKRAFAFCHSALSLTLK